MMNYLNLMALYSMERVQFLKRPWSQAKKSEQQRQRQYHKRPQVVVNNFPDNQDTLKKPKVIFRKFNEQK